MAKKSLNCPVVTKLSIQKNSGKAGNLYIACSEDDQNAKRYGQMVLSCRSVARKKRMTSKIEEGPQSGPKVTSSQPIHSLIMFYHKP